MESLWPSPDVCCACDECCEACQYEETEETVRYFNGEFRYFATAFSVGGFGFPWGHTRVYSNQWHRGNALVNEDIGQGTNWMILEWAYITEPPPGDSNYVISIPHHRKKLFFKKSGTDYLPTYGAEDLYTLTHDSGSGLFNLTTPDGTIWAFNNFSAPSDRRGRLYRVTFPGGQQLTVTLYSNDSLGEVERTYNDGTNVHTEQFQYTYASGQLATVTLRRKIGSGSWTNVRREAYTYYGSSETSGNLGDLKTATVQLPSGASSWTDHENYHYRYYKDSAGGIGFKYGLKYVVGPEAYQRMTNASLNPLTASDSTLNGYADYYLEYDSSQRVTKEVVAGGARTYTFAYTLRSGATTDYSKWARRTILTRPDGSTVTVFTNHIGQVVLHELKESGGAKTWNHYFQYNADARSTLHAHPSAVYTWSLANTSSDLSVTLKTSDGLIELTEYPTSTTATSTVPGDAKGREKYRKIKPGSSGTEITQRLLYYLEKTAGSLTIYPLFRSLVYRNEDGTGGITTEYNYSYFSGTVFPQERVTGLPAILSTQNGSSSSNSRTERFDTWGNTVWSMDERGFINYQAHDIVRGTVTQSIVDVDGSQLTLPSGWSTPTGGGLHLITDYTVDDLGRATRTMGPVHAVDISGTSTNVRTVTWVNHLDDADEVRTAQGYASGTSFGTFTLVNPVAISKMDHAGRTVEQIVATRGTGVTSSGELDPTVDTFAQSTYVRWSKNTYDNQWYLTKSRLYHNIPSSGSGVYYTNYYDTKFLYDNMGRQSQVTTPGGTITQTFYDTRGLATSVKVGAVSSVQIQPRRSWQNPFEPLDADYDGDIDANDSQTVLDWVNAGTPIPEPPTSPPPPPPYPDTNGDGFVAPGDILGAINWVNNGGAHNELTVVEYEYDGNAGGGDSNLTKETRWVDSNSANNRVTLFIFDWRNRRIGVDGEVDLYLEYLYDNLNQLTTVLRHNTTFSGTVIGKQELRYDNLGRVYQSVRYAVDVSTGTVGNSLTDNTWYDPAGNVAKSQPAGSKAFTKTFYDGADRTIKTFIGYDSSETSYVDALTVTGDTIFEQTETSYDAASNIIQLTSKRRFHDATGTGELTSPSGSQPKARVMYVAMYPDIIGRTAAVANYGTNGGSSFTRSATVPTRSDTILVTSTEFNIRGEAYRTIDPAGRDDRMEFDHAGRKTKTIQNYDDGDPTTGAADKDVTVEYTYNPDGKVRTIKARQQSAADDQVTTYVYGVTTGAGSTLYSRDFLFAVVFPDAADYTDFVKYKYNRQGQVVEMTDQNGTVHAYDFDKLGRPTQDRVTTLASGVDGAVRRIGATYEVRSRIEKITSYDNATVGSGSVVNEVQHVYNDFSQLTTQYQDHSGAVSTSTTPKVQYVYANGASNHIRKTSMTYPNGRILRYEYTSGADDNLGRISYLADDSSGSIGTHLAEYTYLGPSTVVKVDYPEPDIRMDLVTGSGSDPYDGLDRFDRVVDLLWRDYGNSADVVRIKHGYDRASNRLWREDPVAATNSKDFDELYSYDGLNQLKTFKRGNLNTSKDGIVGGTLNFEQQWGFDPLGNWSSFKEDAAGDGTFELDQTRSTNNVNEITGITGGSWAVPAYDRNGNMIDMPQPATPTANYSATFDAWNRLVRFAVSAVSIEEYSYNAISWRVSSVSYSGGAVIDTQFYFLSTRWQRIEQRRTLSGSPYLQNVWGGRQFNLVLRDRDTSQPADGSLDERHYSLIDSMGSNVAIAGASGAIIERYTFAAFGFPTYLSSTFGSRSASQFDWTVLFASYDYHSLVGVYHVRFRDYHSSLGRWISRDPLGYFSAEPNLSRYQHNSPLRTDDFLGLADHHWMSQIGKGPTREGERVANSLCCSKGIKLNIDDFTTTLENSHRNTPHWFVHHGVIQLPTDFLGRPLEPYEESTYELASRFIYGTATTCCELMTMFTELMFIAWWRLQAADLSGSLSKPAPKIFTMHPWGVPGKDTTGKWFQLLADACKDQPAKARAKKKPRSKRDFEEIRADVRRWKELTQPPPPRYLAAQVPEMSREEEALRGIGDRLTIAVGVVIICATLTEDLVTLGGGIVDDPVTIGAGVTLICRGVK